MSIRLFNPSGGFIDLNAGGDGTAANTFTLPAETGTLLTSATPVTSIPGYGNLTGVDQWRITASKTITVETTFDANWERADTGGAGSIGSGMTESSGIFTFPSTGYWLIQAQIYYRATGGINAFLEVYMQTTLDNSTYDTGSVIITGGQESNDYGGLYGSFIFDVTSTTTHKFRMRAASQTSSTVAGSTSRQESGLCFIRLGDT